LRDVLCWDQVRLTAFSLPRFVRRASPEGLLSYLQFRSVAPDDDFRWDAPPKALVDSFVRHVRSLADDTVERLQYDLERVEQLSDELGERCCLDSSATPSSLLEKFDALPSGIDRALHVFISDPALFEGAELLRSVEMNRLGRMWEGFIAPAGLEPTSDPSARERLSNALTVHFKAREGTGRSVVVDVFERVRTRGEERQSLLQVMAYVEGLPASSLEFQDQEITRRTRRPVLEVACTYAPDTGELEVLAKGGREQRAVLAKLFMQHLLGCDGDMASFPLRRFTLEPLMTATEFPIDPEDRIAQVIVRRLRLRSLGRTAGSILLERDRSSDRSLHELSSDWFGNNDPLRRGFRVTQAGPTIEFMPTGDRRRGKIVQIDLSLPSGSNLKDRTQTDRLLSEKYLAKWGLVELA
jgi:hypothetical protein